MLGWVPLQGRPVVERLMVDHARCGLQYAPLPLGEEVIRGGEPQPVQTNPTPVNMLTEAKQLFPCPLFFFLTKEYIHAIPHRQPWLHGAYLQSFDTTTTLMKLFLLAYRPQVMT